MKIRYTWIDAMKGIGIFLVVFGHTINTGELLHWIYSFHMPLFFIISGFLVSPPPLRAEGIGDFIKKRLKTLMLPYLTFVVITMAYWFVIERNMRDWSGSLRDVWLNIVLMRGGSDNWPENAVLWFLPCLFLVECLYQVFAFCGSKLMGGAKIVAYAVPVVLIIVGVIWGVICQNIVVVQYGRLPWTLDIVGAALSMYALGAMLARWKASVVGYVDKAGVFRRLGAFLLGVILWGILLCIVWHMNYQINFSEGRFGLPAMLFATAVLGTLGTFAIAVSCNVSLLQRLGQASMVIMGFSEPIKRVLIHVCAIALRMSDDALRSSVVLSLLPTAATLAACYVIYLIAIRYCPKLIGKWAPSH